MDTEMSENGDGDNLADTKFEEMDDSDSDSSSDSSEKMSEEKSLLAYLQALEAIEANKNSYNDYIRLIEASFDLSDLQKIREAYDLFASVFPLAPELWQRRLNIEITLAQSPEEKSELDLLFKRALDDYYAPEIAVLFAANTDTKEIWTEYLLRHVYDVRRGSTLLKAWREKDADRAFDLFKLELSLPLADSEDSFQEAKALFGGHEEWGQMEEKYKKSREVVKILLPFEKKLEKADDHQEKAIIYRDYIEKVSSVCPEMVRALYERLATECCLDYTVWLDYLAFVYEAEPMAGFQDAVGIVRRGLRNCCWSHQLYVEKIRTLESSGLKTEVQAVIEEAAAAGFENPDAMVSIWLEYLTYMARNTNFQETTERDLIRKNFQFCWDTLGQQWGALADTQCKILQFWARLEYGKLGNAVKGRDLWYTVMESADNGTKAVLWTEFAYLEMQRGLEPARKIYRKAVASPNIDDLESLASSWIQFERCYGTLKQLKAAQEFCFPILRQSMLKKKHEKVKKKPEPKPDKPETKPVKRKSEEESVSTKKIKAKPDVESLEAIKDVQIKDTSKDNVCVFLSNLSYDITEDEIVQGFPELSIKSIEIKRNDAGKSRGFCYVELDSESAVTKALSLDRRLIKNRPVFVSKISREKGERQQQRLRYPDSMERNKLFVKGLPFDLSQEELQKLFAPFGSLLDVRLVTHRGGKSKGIAYIEFEKEADASVALLKMDGHEMGGHKMSVAISAPPPKQTQMTTTTTMPRRDPGTAKPRLTLIPTAVQKKVGIKPAGAAAAAAKKNNEEFRQMFLNKK